MEIENKTNGQIQYVKGTLIAGNGAYLENYSTNSTSIFSAATKSPPALISAYGSNNIALRMDGSVTTWGQTAIPTPKLTNVSAVAAGGSHFLALVANGPISSPTLMNPTVNFNCFSVTLLAQSGHVYRLERRDALSSNWQTFPLAAGNGGLLNLSDSAIDISERFYRVRQW
jgi:hypothetical protein